MRDLAITQEYFICAVNEKGKISSFQTEKLICFVAAGLLELQLENSIRIENRKVSVTGELSAKSRHLKPLYDFIDQAKPVRLDKVVEGYYYSFSDKRMNELMNSVGASLAAEGLAVQGKAGVFDNRSAYIPSKEAVLRVVEKLRSELLEDGAVTEETAALAILLKKSGCLKTYFSDFEQRDIKTRLKGIVNSENGRIVKEMTDYVENMTAAMIAAMTVVH